MFDTLTTLCSASDMLTLLGLMVVASITLWNMFAHKIRTSPKKVVIVPVSVNYHFTRHCNADCGFCFHTETSSYKLPLERACEGLRLLANAGMKKANFAGAEPFLYPKYLGELCKYCKEDLRLESVSIVSNGTKVTEKWLRQYGAFVDILAISCDSINPATNDAIGRKDRGSGRPFDNVAKLFEIKEWCEQHSIRFKLNTVVCSLNWDDDMSSMVERLNPFRWKVFQVLVVDGENESDERKRNATKFIINDDQFAKFCRTHQRLKCLVPESNSAMKSSYLIVDEYMRFLDKGDGEEKVSESILDVGVQKAVGQIRWNQEEFRNRGGMYDWTKPETTSSCGGGVVDKNLQW